MSSAAVLEATESRKVTRAANAVAPADQMAASWYAIWTRSHSEQLVNDQLRARGFDVFLPTTAVWSTRRGRPHRNEAPLFPGYLFVRHVMDKHSHVEILKARGVVRVLGDRWDRLATIDDDTMVGLQRLTRSGLPLRAENSMAAGTRVRVGGGPFEGLTGIFVRERRAKGLFVLSIDLLHRSVSVEIECELVQPV